MSIIKSEDSRKWISGLVAVIAILCGYLVDRFVEQLAVWFDLETKITNLSLVSQVFAVFVGVVVFVYLLKSQKSSQYLNEVYNELVKVVWPNKEATMKITIGLVVALVVVSTIFVLVDQVFKYVLHFVY